MILGGLLCLGAFLGCAPGDTITEDLAAGVVYHKIHLLEGPWWIHVVEIDLPTAWAAGVRLRTAMAMWERGGVQKTSSLAAGALAASSTRSASVVAAAPTASSAWASANPSC